MYSVCPKKSVKFSGGNFFSLYILLVVSIQAPPSFAYLLTFFDVIFVLQRKRHYWRLDTKCLTLFNDADSNRYYKVTIVLYVYYI